MNLKGIKVTKKMYKRIIEIGVSNLKSTSLQGLEEFKRFTWSSFTKQEFSSFIDSLDFLEKNEVFSNINDSQLFIFNYYTDVTEMDVVTVLEDKENSNVIIDIEYKSGLEAKEKLDEQITKRVTDHMSQLFLNEKYIIIGMFDDRFYKASYFDSKDNIDITSLSDLKALVNSLTNNPYVETVLTQANDLAGIHNLYKKMESNEFKYYEETKNTTKYIMDKINDGKKAVVCFSSPGTGKTVIAFKIFFENDDTMFLIMNQKFYNSLGLTKYFIKGRCFFGTDTFLHQDLSDKIVIIDEAQRLTKEKIVEIINASKATIIFGDAGQSFMPNDLDLDGHKLVEYIKNNNIYVHSKEIKRSKRFNDSVEKALNFLSSRAVVSKQQIELEDYKINLFFDISDFLDSYHSCKGGKKMFTTFDFRSQSQMIIGDEIFTMADKDFCSFAICLGYENYIGHTLHAISFDVENNYIYLKDVGLISKRGKDVLYKKDGTKFNEEKITKFLNELNILFTRGKKTLNIYTDDLEVYLYLNRKLKFIDQR